MDSCIHATSFLLWVSILKCTITVVWVLVILLCLWYVQTPYQNHMIAQGWYTGVAACTRVNASGSRNTPCKLQRSSSDHWRAQSKFWAKSSVVTENPYWLWLTESGLNIRRIKWQKARMRNSRGGRYMLVSASTGKKKRQKERNIKQIHPLLIVKPGKIERKKFSVNTNTHSTQRKKIWSIDSVGCSPPKTKGKNPLELLSSPPLVAAVLIAQEGAV